MSDSTVFCILPTPVPVQSVKAAQIAVKMQAIVFVVKIPKQEFLAKESQFKRAAATAGAVDVSQVEFISIEDVDFRCILVWLCLIVDLRCISVAVFVFCEWNCVRERFSSRYYVSPTEFAL